jgi:hypothetical protein
VQEHLRIVSVLQGVHLYNLICVHTEKIGGFRTKGPHLLKRGCDGIRNQFSGHQITIAVHIFVTFYILCLML